METLLNTQFIITFSIFAGAALVVFLMRRKAKKPRDSLHPGLVNPLTVALVAGLVGVLAFVHLLTLLGLHK